MSDYFAIVESSGAIVAVCKGDMRYFGDEIAGRDTFPLDEPLPLKSNSLYYYDYATASFVSTLHPTQHHTFDYHTKQWIDPRPLEEIKAQKWAEIKAQRGQLEFGGFAFEGNIYDSDQVSQGRIMGAASAGVDQVWTLVDNTTVELTALQLQQLYAALQVHIASVHERGRIARQLILDAETKEEVEAIQL